MNKVVLATRTKLDGFDLCIQKLENQFAGSNDIAKFYIVCNKRPSQDSLLVDGKPCEIVFDLNPTRPTSFNLVLNKMRKNSKERFHLFTYSKEVDITNKNVEDALKSLEEGKNKTIVVGYRLEDNILSENERKIYANGCHQDNNIGIAYRIPWSTCAIWNEKFVYSKNDKKLIFDEICEEDGNQFQKISVKINGELRQTPFKGMEDGLAIAELITKDSKLECILIEKILAWNIESDPGRVLRHKEKMARKNIVLSTFIQIKGYSVEKLIKNCKSQAA